MANDVATTWGGKITLGRAPSQGESLLGNSSGDFTLVKTTLFASTTYYVSTTGNDDNNGLSASTAFLTVQKAINTALSVNANGFDVAIFIANGTYTGRCIIGAGLIGGGTLYIIGNTSSPGSVILQTTGSTEGSVLICVNGKCVIGGIRFQSTSSSFNRGFDAVQGGVILVSYPIEIGQISNNKITSGEGSYVYIGASVSVSGNAAFFAIAYDRGGIRFAPGITITFTGTPNFSAATVGSFENSVIYSQATFSGAATGTRYAVNANASIQTYGSGVNYFPGNVAGYTSNNGIYL